MTDKEDSMARQFAWLEKNPVENKDLLSKPSISAKKNCLSRISNKKKKNTKAPYHTKFKVDSEIDLHGFDIERAMVKVEREMEALISASYTSMRVIHGHSNSSKESIKSVLLWHLKTKWNQKINRFFQEPHNPGSTCILLKSNS